MLVKNTYIMYNDSIKSFVTLAMLDIQYSDSNETIKFHKNI